MTLTARQDPTPKAGIGSRLKTWSDTDSGRALTRLFKVGVTALVVALLAFQLYRVGWRNVISELPSDWRFYGILLLLYVNLPLAEALVYRVVLHLPFARLVPALVKKRVLNRDLIEYAGEVSFFSWASRVSGLQQRRVFNVIKDNVIASAAGSIIYAVVFVGATVAFGIIPVPEALSSTATLIPVLAVIATLSVVFSRFRHKVFVLSPLTLLTICGLHFFRLAAVSALQIMQWLIVLPNVPLTQLITIHAIQVVAHRIPFLPSRDLVFVGASIELARGMEMSMAEMAGVLVAATAIEKAISLILFGLITATEKRKGAAGTPEDQASDTAVQPAPYAEGR